MASYTMFAISVDTGNWVVECALERYTKQTILSKDYVLNKYKCHILSCTKYQ